MKKNILLFTFLAFFSCTILKAQTLQEVTDNGNDTNKTLKVTNANGIKVINPNITTGYNSILFGQSGSSTQYLRLLPQNTFDGSLLFANSFYFDLTNKFWGVNGDFLFEGVAKFNNGFELVRGYENRAQFGIGWNGYVDESDDEWLLTKTGTSGAELKIKNIDGNYQNSHFLIGGKVGIGTGSPTSQLHIRSNVPNDIGPVLQLQNPQYDDSNEAGSRIMFFGSNLSRNISIDGLMKGYGNADRLEFNFQQDATIVNALTLKSNGRVGIGTNEPSSLLHVNGEGGGSSGVIISNSADSFKSYFQTDDINTKFIMTYSNTGADEIEVQADGDVILAQAGNVGIGTTSPDEKLTVNGTVHSTEVKVDLTVPGPDYVFESDYNLRSLSETEQYIQANKHLPEVPSAKEMEANGIQLGEMNMLLLKKIEELTLYQIELLKRIEKLEEKSGN
jgi:hypothetical protein